MAVFQQFLVLLSFIFMSLVGAKETARDADFPYGSLKPFISDGCTSFSDGPKEKPKLWRHCCDEHDFKYWAGGSSDDRLLADKQLKACVLATGYSSTASNMYWAVRNFGGPNSSPKYRWGFGWEKKRGYSVLTAAERKRAKELSPDNLENN